MKLSYNDRSFKEYPDNTLAMVYQEGNVLHYPGLYLRTFHYSDGKGTARIAINTKPIHESVNDYFV